MIPRDILELLTRFELVTSSLPRRADGYEVLLYMLKYIKFLGFPLDIVVPHFVSKESLLKL